jgi:hypothetical protein
MQEQYCDRYATWDEAKAGHYRIVQALLAGTCPEDVYDDEDALGSFEDGTG